MAIGIVAAIIWLLSHLGAAQDLFEDTLSLDLLREKVLNDPEALAHIETKKKSIISLYKKFPYIEAPYSESLSGLKRQNSIYLSWLKNDTAQAGCSYLRTYFDPSHVKVSVDIRPEPDVEEYNGPRKITVTKTVAVSAAERNGWNKGGSGEDSKSSSGGVSASLGGGVFGSVEVSGSVTVLGSQRWESGSNGEKGHDVREEKVASSEVECPEAHVCQSITWTYVIEISGPVITIPTLDEGCMAEEVAEDEESRWEPCSWCRLAYVQVLRGQRLSGNISYAALPESKFDEMARSVRDEHDPMWSDAKKEREIIKMEFFRLADEDVGLPGYLYQGVYMPPQSAVKRYMYEEYKTFGHTLRYADGRMWSTSFFIKSMLNGTATEGFPSEASDEYPPGEACRLESGWEYAPGQKPTEGWLRPPPGQRPLKNSGWELREKVASPPKFGERCPNVRTPPRRRAKKWMETKYWCLLEDGWEYTETEAGKWFRPPAKERRRGAGNRAWMLKPTWAEPDDVERVCPELGRYGVRRWSETKAPSTLIQDDTPDLEGGAPSELYGVFDSE